MTNPTILNVKGDLISQDHLIDPGFFKFYTKHTGGIRLQWIVHYLARMTCTDLLYFVP